VLGKAMEIKEKLSKLKLFYKNVLTKVGFNKYSEINLSFKNQLVAKLAGIADKAADSLRTLQLMQETAAYASRMAEDTMRQAVQTRAMHITDTTVMQQSVERDEEADLNEKVVAQTLNQATKVAPVMRNTTFLQKTMAPKGQTKSKIKLTPTQNPIKSKQSVPVKPKALMQKTTKTN
jgi:cell division protein FtsQ